MSVPDPLRVILDARFVDGSSGGIQQWVIGLASALSNLDDLTEEYLFLVTEGHDGWLQPFLGGRSRLLQDQAVVRAAAPASRPNHLRGLSRLSPRVPILRSMRRKARQAAAASPARPSVRAVEGAGAHVMHFTRQAAFSTSVPSIYQPWDLQHLHVPEFFTEADRIHREQAYRAYCDQAQLIIVPTRWVKDDVVMQYGLSVDQIAVVNPPPPIAAYVPPTASEEAEIATRLELPPGFLFYPAQPWRHKNHERLLAAVADLRRGGVEIPVIFSGRKTERTVALEELARELRLGEQVRFLGFVNTTEIQVLYRRATCLVFPSLYEGWGLPIVEAFAAGLPVASSNVTSLPALVGDAGLLFDPYEPSSIADAVRRLWTDPQLREALIERGRARAAQFEWRRTALLMRAHYRTVAGRPLTDADRDLLAAPSVI